MELCVSLGKFWEYVTRVTLSLFFGLTYGMWKFPGPGIEHEPPLPYAPQLWQCWIHNLLCHIYIARIFFFFLLFRASPVAYGGSLARGCMGDAVSAFATAIAMPLPESQLICFRNHMRIDRENKTVSLRFLLTNVSLVGGLL